MAASTRATPAPTEIKLHQKSRVLEVAFADGKRFRLPFEFLRVYSPSAEVRGHGPGQEVLQTGKRDVAITRGRAGRPLRRAARVLRRPRHRHLLVGLPLRPRRAAGQDVAAVSGAAASSRREPRRARSQRHDKTHFGFEQVPDGRESAAACAACSTRSPSRYDLMNDLMSAGPAPLLEALHGRGARARGPASACSTSPAAPAISRSLFAERVGASGEVVLTDINGAMLRAGRDRLLDARRGRCRPCNATPSAAVRRQRTSTASASPSACAT